MDNSFINTNNLSTNTPSQSWTDLAIENNAMSKFDQKLVNTVLTAEQKLDTVEKYKLNKQLDLDGFQNIRILSMLDEDSGIAVDAQGNEFQFRLSDFNKLDGIDSEDARNNSYYKMRTQPESVANLTGKRVQDLTEDDFKNVKNYQFQEMIGSLTNANHKFNPYNPNQKYGEVPFQPVDALFKIVGKDKYGRVLTEAVNPQTGRQLSFDMSNNPYLNASFDVFNSVNSKQNRKRLLGYQTLHRNPDTITAELQDVLDNDGRFAEDLDIVQSTAYQSAARLLQYAPDWMVDVDKWKQIANPKTGQAIADAWAGVKTSTRRDFANGMLDAMNDWENGNYLKSLWGYATQLDRVLSESATQMGLMTVGGLTGAGLAGMAGIGGVAAGAIAAISGAILASVDQTLMTMEDYKENNNGKDMSAKDVAIAGFGNMLTFIPETLLGALHFTKFIPKSVRSTVTKAYKSNPLLTRGGTLAGSVIGEGTQELVQDTWNDYMSQNQADKKSLLEIADSPEKRQSFVVGALMGGALSTPFQGIGLAKDKYQEKKADKVRTQEQNRQNNTTIVNTKADNAISSKIQQQANTITVDDYTDSKLVGVAYAALEQLIKDNKGSLNETTVHNIRKQQADIIRQFFTDSSDTKMQDSFLKALGKTREQIFKEEVFFSDSNAQNSFMKKQKFDKNAFEEEALEFADKIGLSKTEAKKLLKEVAVDVRDGARGYNNYARYIQEDVREYSDPSITEKRRKQLADEIEGVAYQTLHLWNSHLAKLVQFAQAGNEYAKGYRGKPIHFQYENDPTGQGFTLNYSNLANYSYDSGHGAHGVVQSIVKELEEMSAILDTVPSEIMDKITANSTNTYSKADITNTLNTYKNAAYNVRHKINSEVKAKDQAKGYISKLSDREITTRLHDLVKGTNPKKEAVFTAELRNISNNQVQSAKTYIQKSNLKNKGELLNRLMEIRKLNTTSEEEAANLAKIAPTAIAEAKAINDKYSKEKFENVTIQELRNIYREVLDATQILNGSTDVNVEEKLKESLEKLLATLAKKGNELREKELKKQAQEIINKANQEESEKLDVVKATTKLSNTEINDKLKNIEEDIYKLKQSITKYSKVEEDEVNKAKELYQQLVDLAINQESNMDKHNVGILGNTGKSLFRLIANEFPDYMTSKELYDSLSQIRQDLSEFAGLSEQGKVIKDLTIYKREATKNNTTKTETDNKSESASTTYINHSGGAKGSDSAWGIEGRKYGVTSRHYYGKNKTPYGNTQVSEEELREGYEKIKKANQKLGRRVPAFDTVTGQLLSRNWSQVKNADAIFAIGSFVVKGSVNKAGYKVKTTQVDGGTGWAVQMAIDAGKPVYVFDQTRGQWFKYNGKRWVNSNTPTLTSNFAGIGTRDITQAGRKAITEVYEKTFKPQQATSIESDITKTEEQSKYTLPLVGNTRLQNTIKSFNDKISSKYTPETIGKIKGDIRSDINRHLQRIVAEINRNNSINDDVRQELLSKVVPFTDSLTNTEISESIPLPQATENSSTETEQTPTEEVSTETTPTIDESNQQKIDIKSKPIGTKESPVQIYSDGSDIKGTGKIGYGAVFEYNGKEYALSGTNEDNLVKELKDLFPDAEFSNPTMEMLALATVLETIANLGIAEHITINQDYKGAVNYGKLWNNSKGSQQRADKAWKAKKPYIQYLVSKAEKAIETIEANGGSVSIQWVKGHQKGQSEQARMNDLADKHAKSRSIYNNFAEAYNTTETTQETTSVTQNNETKSTQSKRDKLIELAKQRVDEIIKKYPLTIVNKPISAIVDEMKQLGIKIRTAMGISNEEILKRETPLANILYKLSEHIIALTNARTQYIETLRKQREQSKTATTSITNFHTPETEFLSNFYRLDIPITLGNLTYPSVEHAFQAAKTINEEERKQFTNPNMTPAQAKAAGKKIKLRKDWNQIKLKLMKNLVLSKFKHNPNLIDKLLATGDKELIEGNNWNDSYWGVTDWGKGKGQNHLGKILMEVRDELRQEIKNKSPFTLNASSLMERNPIEDLDYQNSINLYSILDQYEILRSSITDEEYKNLPQSFKDTLEYYLKTVRETLTEVEYKYATLAEEVSAIESEEEQIKAAEISNPEDFVIAKQLAEFKDNLGTDFDINKEFKASKWAESTIAVDGKYSEGRLADVLAILNDKLKLDFAEATTVKSPKSYLTKKGIQISLRDFPEFKKLLSNEQLDIASIIEDTEKQNNYENLPEDVKKVIQFFKKALPILETVWTTEQIKAIESKDEIISYLTRINELRTESYSLGLSKDTFNSIHKGLKDFETALRQQKAILEETVEENGRNVIDSAPHLRFLYDITTEGKSVNFEFNPQTVAVLDFTLHEVLAQSDIANRFNSQIAEWDLAQQWGLNWSMLDSEDFKQLREVMKKHGTRKDAFASILGKAAVRNLGITATKDATRGYLQKLEMGLGLFMIQWLKAEGILIESEFDLNKWKEEHPNESHVLNYSHRLIKLGDKKKIKGYVDRYLGTKDAQNKRLNDGLKQFKRVSVEAKRPRTYKESLPHNLTKRNTQGLSTIPGFVKKVLAKLWNTPYQIDTELADFVSANRATIAKRLGVKDQSELDALSFDASASAEGVNLAITSQLDYLEEYAKEQRLRQELGADGVWYFRWFMSRNGRLFMDSNTLNPQTGKAITRFLCLPQKVYRTFRPDNIRDKKCESYAIAQAFDLLKATNEQIDAIGEAFNKLELEEIIKFRQDMVDLSEKAFSEKWSKRLNELKDSSILSKDIELGIENFGQCLNVLQHFIRKKEANGKEFKTWLAVENDSTTSGYFIRFLEFPVPSVLKSFMDKVGILSKDNEHGFIEMHELKTQKGFLDIYKTTALTMSKFLQKYVDKNGKVIYDPDENIYKKSKIDYRIIKHTFELMYSALPQPDADGGVTSALRTLMKSPTMTYGYMSGENTIAKNLAYEIGDEFINTYMQVMGEGGLAEYEKKHGKDAKIETIMKTMDNIKSLLSNPNANLYQMLKKQSTSDIKLKVKNKDGKIIYVSIDQYFREVLAPIYGKSVWKALEASFSEYKPYNQAMSDMVTTMFRLFEIKLNEKIREVSDVNGTMSVEDYNRIVSELKDLFPAIPLAYSEDADSGMFLMDMDKQRDNSTQASNLVIENGRVKSENAFSDVKAFVQTGTGKAGAVIPIHFIDGMGMAMLLHDFPNVIPVHDAVVMSAMDGVKITQKYNRDMVALSKEYNVFDKIYEQFMKVCDSFGDTEFVDNIALRDGTGELRIDTPTDPQVITIKEFKQQLANLASENNSYREAFYNTDVPIYITNMDGMEDSGVELNLQTLSLPEILFKQATDKWTQYSDPNGYVSTNEITHIIQQANTSPDGCLKLFDTLQQLASQLGNKLENKGHIRHLQELIKKINPEFIRNLIVQYSPNREYASGQYNYNPDSKESKITIGFDDHTANIIDSFTRLSPLSGKSPAEIYAHELMHHAIRAGLATLNILKRSRIRKQLENVYEQAKDIIKWQDLMPVKYDLNLRQMYEAEAKKLWNYMFDNPNTETHNGLHEFIVHALTNEKVMNILKQHNYINKAVSGQPQNLLQKVIALGKLLLDVVFGETKLRELPSISKEIIAGTFTSIQRDSLFAEVDKLVAGITNVNVTAGTKLFNVPIRGTELIFTLFGRFTEWGKNVVSPKLQYAINFLDMRGNPFLFNLKLTGTWFDDLKLYGNAIIGSLFSERRRKVLTNIILPHIIGLSQQGAILCALRDMTAPDIQSQRLEALSALTRNVEQASKALETTCYTDLTEAFGKKDLTNEEDNALTYAGLKTDLSCLLEVDSVNGSTNIDSLLQLITDDKAISREINNIIYELKKNKHSRWYINQAKALAQYMVTGIGNEALNLNARNIATGKLTGKDIQTTEQVIELIDKLTTLTALQLTDKKHRTVFASMKKEGLENFLKTHKKFVAETNKGVQVTETDKMGNMVTRTVYAVDSIHVIKGYTKQLLDTSYDLKWDLASNELDLKKEGYIKLRDLDSNSVTKNNFALYRRSFATPNRRDGAVVSIVGKHNIGTSLKDTAYDLFRDVDEAQKKTLAKNTYDIYRANANKIQQRLISEMQKKELTLDDINKMSSGFTPIVSPITNMTSDYRITMSDAHKISDLNMNTSGRLILSKMYASQNTKITAETRNKVILEWLKDDMKQNMVRNTGGLNTDKEGHVYVKIHEKTTNKFLQKAWAVMPKEFKEEATKGSLYIREDWLQDIFGIPSLSLAETKLVNNQLIPAKVKRLVAIAEYILKTLTYMLKQNIVIKVPNVLIGNILSNLAISVANGSNPIKVARYTISNAKAIKDYIDNKKQLNRIEFKERIGTATEAELKTKNWLKSKLENNIVHPLMEKGMYQAITEDIKMDDLETIGKVNKFMKNVKLYDKIPNGVKQFIRQAYLGEGTPYYEFMRQATQYSDFVARATEYQLRMEKAPERWEYVKDKKGRKIRREREEYTNYEEALTANVWNYFINYDKPQSALLQYLNDIGLAMFTKFALRIQHVISSGLIKNPIGSLLFIIGQATIMDTEDIYEQNIFNKNWSALIYNPVDNFINVAVPMPLQYFLGMRHL